MDRPNVVLVTLDSTRRDRLSCYGYERETSPTIDEFAAEATRYDNAVSQSTWSLPTHASIFTGRYPSEHGATFVSPFLADETTLAERLQEEGYDTIGVSPNFVVRPTSGLHAGFDHFSTPQVGNIPDPLIPPFNKCMDVVSSSIPLRRLSEQIYTTYHQLFQSRAAERIEQARSPDTIDSIRECLDASDDPFFLFANFMDPHMPHHPKERFRKHFVEDESLEVPMRASSDMKKESLSDRQIRKLNQLYDADIRAMDHYLGQLFDLLKERGCYEDSLIILVADHGESLGEERVIGHKVSVSEHVINVPLLIKYPDHQEAEVVEEPVETRKIFHTIVNEATEENMDGLEDPEGGIVLGEYFPPMIDFERAREDGEWVYTDTTTSPVRYARNAENKVILHDGTEHAVNVDDGTTMTDEERFELLEEIDKRLGSLEPVRENFFQRLENTNELRIPFIGNLLQT
ncbi:MAG: sulfatase [Candidatus Nanohaloarchaea archaeon]|nr:sulfatase [Candidatus Nanohaloarchaea archaeon]